MPDPIAFGWRYTMEDKRPVGKTKDVGFVFGLRKTFPITLQDAWALLMSEKAVKAYLGDVSGDVVRQHNTYQTADGTTGEFRIVKPLSHLRFTWQPTDWDKPSTVQIRVISTGSDKTVISFHQENLKDAQQREAMNMRWHEVMKQLENMMR